MENTHQEGTGSTGASELYKPTNTKDASWSEITVITDAQPTLAGLEGKSTPWNHHSIPIIFEIFRFKPSHFVQLPSSFRLGKPKKKNEAKS